MSKGEVTMCPRCRVKFVKTANSSKFCSLDCRHGPGQCIECFKVFQKKRHNQNTCHECIDAKMEKRNIVTQAAIKQQAHDQLTRKSTRIPKPPANGKCGHCGEPVTPPRTGRPWPRYCSASCSTKYRKERFRERGICFDCKKRDALPDCGKCAMCMIVRREYAKGKRKTLQYEPQDVNLNQKFMSYTDALNKKNSASAANKELNESHDSTEGWARFDIEYDSTSSFYLSDEYRNAERVKNLHAIMITKDMVSKEHEAPDWSKIPFDNSHESLYDEEGEEVVGKRGIVEDDWGRSPFTPRELLAMGVKGNRQIKQWLFTTGD